MGSYCVSSEGTDRDNLFLVSRIPTESGDYSSAALSRPSFGSLARGACMLALCLLAMPNIWAGTTVDGTQCRLNSDPAGLVAFVGKGSKKTTRKVASRSTSLSECIANMARVIDPGPEPRPLPPDLYTLLSELPLLAGNASEAVRARLMQESDGRLGCPDRTSPLLLAGVQ